jgi:hypothetical protein
LRDVGAIQSTEFVEVGGPIAHQLQLVPASLLLLAYRQRIKSVF